MIVLPWQLSGKACCGSRECSLSGHRCVEAEARAVPRGSGCGINSRAGLAGG